MQPFMKRHWYGLGAPYVMGKEPEATLSRLKGDLFTFIGAHEKDRFHFCHSGKEGQFQVLHAFYADHVMEQGKNHIFIDQECDTADRFEGMGLAVKILPKNEQGQITKEALEKMISPKTGLVSLSWADGKTGVIQPIWELGEFCREKGILFHVDASHTLGKLYFKFQEMPIDFLSFDGSLIHGPRGSGALFVRREIEFNPVETELNLPLFVGLGIAIEELSESFDHLCMETVRLRDKFEEGVKLGVPEVTLFYQDVERLPNTSVIEFPGVKRELLAFHLKERGVYVSFDHEKESTLSFSLSRLTTEEEIDQAIGIVVDAAQKCRTFSKELI
jgi:cysteine desulfurase